MQKTQTAAQARKRLREFATVRNADAAKWFFKTDDGGYSAHDRFIGVKVPNTRIIAKEFRDLSLPQVQILLRSKIHEQRLLALIILVNRAKKCKSLQALAPLHQFYMKNLKHVNNWDLVDVSAEHLIGAFLFMQSSVSAEANAAASFSPSARAIKQLNQLAKSKNLWFRRISIISTFYGIRRHQFELTFAIADLLLNDPQDLIHKAVGWMLRETGNRAPQLEHEFLKIRYKNMPRTMLRYAIEKFPEKKRQAYLKGKI